MVDPSAPGPDTLALALREVEERLRQRNPQGRHLNVELANLMPLLHSRDAAEGRAAAIGGVNPRPPGVVHGVIQSAKRAVARGLNWFVRDQIDFNLATVACVNAAMEALNETNRALVQLAREIAAVRDDGESVADLRARWIEWHHAWEAKFADSQIQLLRHSADVQAAYQHRLTLAESAMREQVGALRAQWEPKLAGLNGDVQARVDGSHARFEASLGRATHEIQARLWADMERVRREYERLIHEELRLVRQRAAVTAPTDLPARPLAPTLLPFDYGRFAVRFRGDERHVKTSQARYVPRFAGCTDVLDVGCGRGEFLELLRDAGIASRGIDGDAESVAVCRTKGLSVDQADLFEHLDNLPTASLDGLFCGQVVEHLSPERVPELVKLAARALRRDGVLVMETPNPECLAIFATHFYLDPTHTRPVPPHLLVFYCEEFGFGGIEVERVAQAIGSMPSIGELPAAFRDAFFGGLDYAVVARRL